jgi:UDP-GlcNAc:undecaprenyl-phosphate GlcNAc-1-phosphate transferase
MKSFVTAFFFAMGVCAALTPLVRRFALQLGAVSQAGGRNVNTRAIPRLGGIAIAAAVCAPLLSLFVVDAGAAVAVREQAWLVAGTVFGGALLCIVGAIDDVRGVRAVHKLGLQVVAALVAYACGLRIEEIYLPLVGNLSMGVFAAPVTVLWIVGVTNAVNLIDGLDGLAAGVVFCAALTNFVLAVISGNVLLAALMASVMGSLIGFLFYNFNPARIFMGDSGSYFLGFILATTSIAGSSHKASTAVALLGPMVALGLPIFDTLFSMLRRAIERRPLFSPDRGHIHHRLLDMGLTHRRAVLILYGVSLVLTAAGIAISLGRRWEMGLALLGSMVVMGGLVRFVGYFEYLHARRRQRSGIRDAATERLRRAAPQLLTRCALVDNERALWQELDAFAEAAGLSYVECAETDGTLVHGWKASEPTEAQVTRAKFFVGREGAARMTVRFGWSSEHTHPSPQDDILLQLVVDALEKALQRTGSQWAPKPSESRVSVPNLGARATVP